MRTSLTAESREWMLTVPAPAPSFRPFEDDIDPAHRSSEDPEQPWQDMVRLAHAEEIERLGASSYNSGGTKDSSSRLRPEPSRVNFIDIGHLGDGVSGYVRKVKVVSTGTVYAMKVRPVNDSRPQSNLQQQVENEMNIMGRLSHHHITRLRFWDYDEDRKAFKIFMTPVADGNLKQYLEDTCILANYPPTELFHLTSWFGCLLSALSYAHAMNVKHQDIKPANILIKNRQPYFTDFGHVSDLAETTFSTSDNMIYYGTLTYLPPEPLSHDRATDIFSLGCVFSEMLTVRQQRTLRDYQNYRHVPQGESPYAFRRNLTAVYHWIRQLGSADDPVTDLLVNQILDMMHRDPGVRPEARTIIRAFEAEHESLLVCDTCF